MALCALNSCDNKAAKLSKYCSLACAEKQISELRKAMGPRRRFSPEEIKKAGFAGDFSPANIRGLNNPFGDKSAAHVAFEILRNAGLSKGINREEFIDRLVEICIRKNVALHSPRERVRRVMTEIRAMGFELLKDDAGRIGLTGRRVM